METNILIDKDIVIYALLMTFVLKIVAFMLGFLTIKMGNNLMKDGIKGGFKFSTEAKGIKGALESGSPGLLFVLLGIVLIGYAMFLKKGVELSEYSTTEPLIKRQVIIPKDTGSTLVKPHIGPFDTSKNFKK